MKFFKNFFAKPEPQPIFSEFTDSRDNQTYRTVQLKDGNIWMAQNYNYDVGDGCYFFNNDPISGKKFGRLYNWDAALKACPSGWHLPSAQEWWDMVKCYAENFDVKKEKAKMSNSSLYFPKLDSFKSLIEGGKSGFSAQLGGCRYSDGSFKRLNSRFPNMTSHFFGYYWTSTPSDDNKANNMWKYTFDSFEGRVSPFPFNSKETAFSCRYVKNVPNNSIKM